MSERSGDPRGAGSPRPCGRGHRAPRRRPDWPSPPGAGPGRSVGSEWPEWPPAWLSRSPVPVGVVTWPGSGDGGQRRPARRGPAHPTGPTLDEGYRWESWHGVTVQVPGTWDVRAASATGARTAARSVPPRVERPGAVANLILCEPGSTYGLTLPGDRQPRRLRRGPWCPRRVKAGRTPNYVGGPGYRRGAGHGDHPGRRDCAPRVWTRMRQDSCRR